MDTLKLIVACAVIVGLAQLELDGGNPQRKYYAPQGKTTNPQEAAQIIQEKRQAALAAQAESGSQEGAGICTGGICGMRAIAPAQATETPLYVQQEELQAQIEEQKQMMDEQAAKLRELQEKYDALQTFTQQTHD